MFKPVISVSLCLTLITPLQAQTLPGAEDTAFQATLTSLLATDDPAAVAALRELAEAGNTAALITLPFALLWVPPKGNLKEKNAQRRVGDINAQDAAEKAHEATALWDAGNLEDASFLPDRAAGLLAFGETEKASYLISAWVNQTGGRGDLPPQLLTEDTPAMLGAFALYFRMLDAVYNSGSGKEEAVRLMSLMREEGLPAWVTYVHLMESTPDVFDIIGNSAVGSGLSAADVAERIEDARAVRAVWLNHDEVPTPATTAERARRALAGRAELLPVTRLCEARCPDSIATCEAAYLAFPGNQFGATTIWQPFADALDPVTYLASDRGLYLMIRPRKDPAAAADRATAEGIDACYAKVLAHWDTLYFGR